VRIVGIGILATLAAALLFGQPAGGKSAKQPRTAITCNWPVGPFDSARDVLRRFGRQARMADIGTGEGEIERGVVLFPGDPRRRIEVLFWGADRFAPQSVRFVGEGAPWTVVGIRLGDPLESVSRRNGRAMHMQMFGADYGGTVQSFDGGKLETSMGDCEPEIVFSPTAGSTYPDSLSGDGVIESDHPDMAKARVHVSILGVHFAPPTDQ
jgi:hypothetical protein